MLSANFRPVLRKFHPGSGWNEKNKKEISLKIFIFFFLFAGYSSKQCLFSPYLTLLKKEGAKKNSRTKFSSLRE